MKAEQAGFKMNHVEIRNTDFATKSSMEKRQ